MVTVIEDSAMEEDECRVWLIWRRGPGIEALDSGESSSVNSASEAICTT
jgi:hypothetical protein